MDFLKDYNFNEEEINEVLNANSKGIINNIIYNKENVCEIIDYFLALDIEEETIKKMFKYQIGIFFKTKKELIDAFEEYEMESIIKSLNYDVNTFDLIEF